MISQKAKQILYLLKNSFDFFSQHCLRIRDKNSNVVPFVLNKAQKYLQSIIDQQYESLGYARVVVLKGRQQGISTYVQGRYYWKTSLKRGARAFILTHEADATKNLFEMTKRYHDLNEVTVEGVQIKPSTGNDSQKELNFSEIDSGYKVGTAGNKAVGRGSTVQFLHGSEVAFWPNAEEHLAGLLQAVPKTKNTEVILESTANGVGGVFYDYVMQAYEDEKRIKAGKEPEQEFRLCFIPWYWQDEYTSPVLVGFERTEEEKRLADLYGLNDGQLKWRREKIYELKSVDKFKQEYPMNVEEAFLFSGRPAFDINHILEAEKECFKPSVVGEIGESGFIEKDKGALKIWDRPKPTELYAIGADIAEGLEGGDYTVIQVCDREGMQVACWHGHVDPDMAGDIIYKIGKMYNMAFIGVERNNHGLTTLTRLRNLNYPYLYSQENLESRAEGDQSVRFGWLTTAKSKPLIIDHLSALLRDGESGIADIDLISELKTYIIEANGSYNAQTGCHDDRIMAYAICLEMLRRMPKNRYIGRTKTHKPVTNTAW